MLFNSLHFIIFFPIVVTIYFSLPQRFRWLLLLLASYYFYMAWRPTYALFLLFITTVDYLAGRAMGVMPDKRRRLQILLSSFVVNLGLLFFFKYADFFSSSLNSLFSFLRLPYDIPLLELILPIGISFYVFQSLSYTIDVYRGIQPPEKHFGIFALYVVFFPQLVAGPIERPQNLLPQFFIKQTFSASRLLSGLRRMLWGFFKKMVIADNLAIFVNEIYASPDNYAGLSLLVATYFFAFQIYCDFSGYADIALGSAKVLGYELRENFNQPYFAKSIQEFWRRWHMSLSAWFRDYLYIPLGGNRVAPGRWRNNVLLVFAITGLWHGANWTFVVWGLLHGFYIIIGKSTAALRERFARHCNLNRLPTIRAGLQIFLTFHLVLFAWIFFRARTMADAWFIFTHFFSPFSFHLPTGLEFDYPVLLAIVVMVSVEFIKQSAKSRLFLLKLKPFVRYSAYGFVFSWLLWSILLFGDFGSQEFIYFQF